MATLTPENEKNAKKVAKAKGLNWADLTDKQKEDLYLDYEGMRDLANAEYAAGDERLNMAGPEGRQVGGIYAASNPLEHLATSLRQYQGGKAKQTAKGELADLSARQAAGRATAGGLAAQREAEQNRLYEKMIEAQRQSGTQVNVNNQPSGPVMQGGPVRANQNPVGMMQPPQQPSGGQTPGDAQGWYDYMKGAKFTRTRPLRVPPSASVKSSSRFA